MTRSQRIGLLAAAVVVAVAAFVIAQSGGDSNDNAEPATSGGSGTQSTQSSQPAQPQAFRINVKGGVVDGDTQTFTVKKNDIVRIVVSSDAPDQIHLHGYDIEKEADAGQAGPLRVQGERRGRLQLESHAAEDAGNEPLLAHLHVEPVITLFAHAGGLLGRADLPIPEWLFGWAAAMVLFVSFVALAVAVARAEARARPLAAAARAASGG